MDFKCLKFISFCLLQFILGALIISVNAEGTKQLRPTEANFGSLHISRRPIFTLFAQYNSPDANRLKIRIGAVGEIIYFGFNNHLEGGDFEINVPYRIVSPSGAVVFTQNTMPTTGQPGYINTWSQAVAGPSQLGAATGYNAQSLTALQVGDYYIEFDISDLPVDDQVQFDLFDITVANNGIAIPGRLHCQSWQISTENANNSLFAKVYPYNVKGVVYEVDFNQMNPFTFVINFNSLGTDSSGVIVNDRQSKQGRFLFPKYEVFLNPPDPLYYPSIRREVTFRSEARFSDCTTQDYCLNFTSNSEGILDGYIDINGDGNEDPNDVRFSEVFETINETKCVRWNGRDRSGAVADLSRIKIYSNFGYGVTHLPLYDVEDNRLGFKVRIVSPVQSPVNLFWDDSRITAGTATDRRVSLTGCENINGCHRWTGRGDNENNAETINTWWYTTLLYDTLLFDVPSNPPVKLSYDPSRLSNRDTVLCQGDDLSIFIYNDGSHYDANKFNYQWFLNAQLQSGSLQELARIYSVNSQVVVTSSLKTNPGCVSSDTILVNVVPPVKIRSAITLGDCVNPLGSINTTLLTGPPGAVFTWRQFPGNRTGVLSNLQNGTYNLSVSSPQFPGKCGLDTSFVIQNAGRDSIDTDFSFKNQTETAIFWEGDVIQFTSLFPALASTSAWTFGDGNSSTELNPSNRYDSAGTYVITLTTVGINGCPGRKIKTLEIRRRIPCGAELPNTFTPNGDGSNDDIGILGNVISMDLIVFNRWGEAIFRSFEKPHRWNGIYRNQESPIGVYPYLLVFECPDEFGKLIKKRKVGEITLVR